MVSFDHHFPARIQWLRQDWSELEYHELRIIGDCTCPVNIGTDAITKNANMNMKPKSSNVIYCITCKQCQKQCVDQTGNTLHERFGAYPGSIGRNKITEDVSHLSIGTGANG